MKELCSADGLLQAVLAVTQQPEKQTSNEPALYESCPSETASARRKQAGTTLAVTLTSRANVSFCPEERTPDLKAKPHP